MSYCFAPEAPTCLSVEGTDEKFPVRRVYCVGRNYADHAVEMGGDPDREPPFFFSKPGNAVVSGKELLTFPRQTDNLHHEAEMVVALASGGKDISIKEADSCIFGYAMGVDLTRRDWQDRAKAERRPWDMSKGFDESAPMGALVPVEKAGDIMENRIWLSVNGQVRQDGSLAQMIWKVPEMIAYLSEVVELKAGDLIMTGTPAGVGQLVPGDKVEAGVDGLPVLKFGYHDRRTV